MDPSIMRLLEEDEDESMHSGADVEAFTAALNRDIEGGTSSTQPSHSDISALSQGSSQTSSQMYSKWNSSSQDENSGNQCQQSSVMEVKKEHEYSLDIQHDVNGPGAPSGLSLQCKPEQVDGQGHHVEEYSGKFSQSGLGQIQKPDKMVDRGSESQFSNMQRFSSKQVPVPKQIPFGRLLPIILPELDKDRAMQLQTLYSKLRLKEIPKEGFVKLMKTVVGDQMLRLAVVKMQAKSQSLMEQQHLRPPTNPYSFGHVHQKSQSTLPVTVRVPSNSPSIMQQQKDSSHQSVDNNSLKSRDVDYPKDSHVMQANQIPGRSAISIQGLTKQQQQHLHFSQSSFPVYGASSYNSRGGANVDTSSTTVESKFHQGFGSTQADGTSQAMNVMNVPEVETKNSFGDSKNIPGATKPNMSMASSMQHGSTPWPSMVEQRKAVSGTSNGELLERQHLGMALPPSTRITIMASSSSVSSHVAASLDADFQAGRQATSAGPMSGTGANAKASAKKPSTGQKKPLDAHASSPTLPSKKQKVSGALSDQSIEHLNDVTAVSGVNLKEEEEQLFCGAKDDSRVSEASRMAVQEEEDRLILQKLPLQKKLAEIMTKCGLTNLSNDVERCLSLCVEERLRGLISSLIRVSKHRVNSEKSRHNIVITSDVREQILTINRKAREEWEKKQAEVDKLRKQNEPESSSGDDIDKEKDEGRGKSVKANKEDDKMLATAANVAARAAAGGDDMLSRWQLIAQARHKSQGRSESPSIPQVGKDSNHKPIATSVGNIRDVRGSRKWEQLVSLSASGELRQLGRGEVASVAPGRSISIKDVIAVLEREPQMAKSTLIYGLYDRMRTDVATQ